MISKQLLIRAEKFDQDARLLLANPGHGIPSLSDILYNGRRIQDATNLKEQVNSEKAGAANLSRDVLTFEMIRTEACGTQLSNDRVMKLGEERLQLRLKIAEISTKRVWINVLKIPSGKVWYKYVMQKAFICYPFIPMMVFRKKIHRGYTRRQKRAKSSDSI